MVTVLQPPILVALPPPDFLQYVGLCLVLGGAKDDATLQMQPDQPISPPW